MSTSIDCILISQRKNENLEKLTKTLKLRPLVVYAFQNYVLSKLKKLVAKNKKLKVLKGLFFLLEISNYSFKFKYLFHKEALHYDLFYYLMRNVPVYANMNADSKTNWMDSLVNNYWIFILYFGFKVFEWKFNRATQQEVRFEATAAKVAAPVIPYADNGYKRVCKLCNKVIQDFGMVKTSNIVYCFDCLSTYVIKNKKCPYSGLSLDVQDVHKLYLN